MKKVLFSPHLHVSKQCYHLLQLKSMEQDHSENILRPFVASRASLMMSKGIHLAKTSLIIPKDLKLLL